MEIILIKKPTFRVIAECILGKGPGKTLGLRMDTLAQLTTLACVRSGGMIEVVAAVSSEPIEVSIVYLSTYLSMNKYSDIHPSVSA